MSAVIGAGKSAAWPRALLGGFLSVLLVGTALFALSFNRNSPSIIELYLNLLFSLPGIFLHTGLFGDPFAKLLAPADALVISWRIILLALTYWFISGFGIAYFIQNNKRAMTAWCIMVIALGILLIFWW